MIDFSDFILDLTISICVLIFILTCYSHLGALAGHLSEPVSDYDRIFKFPVRKHKLESLMSFSMFC